MKKEDCKEDIFEVTDQVLARHYDRSAHITGVELGVAEGNTSARLLAAWPNLTLYMVDAWSTRVQCADYIATGDMKAQLSAEKMRNALLRTLSQVAPYMDRARIVVAGVAEARAMLALPPLDFVIHDADHSYETVRADLRLWGDAAPLLLVDDYYCPPDRSYGVEAAVRELYGDAGEAMGRAYCLDRLTGAGQVT